MALTFLGVVCFLFDLFRVLCRFLFLSCNPGSVYICMITRRCTISFGGVKGLSLTLLGDLSADTLLVLLVLVPGMLRDGSVFFVCLEVTSDRHGVDVASFTRRRHNFLLVCQFRFFV